jgi:hypothetical protein
MRADQLYVVTAIANPLLWRSRGTLYRLFEQHMLDSGVDLTVVECAYGDRPFEFGGAPSVRHIPVRARTMVWVKENLINLGIARLPDQAKYIAWIDADVTFRRADWAAATVDALQFYDVLQPWSDCYDLGPRGEHMQLHRSFCRQWRDGKPIGNPYATFAHPGYAWAATRQALEWLGGLVETAALGAADHHMAMALIGRVAGSVPSALKHPYLRPLHAWQQRAAHHVAGNIGVLDGTIEHGWHGQKKLRRYVERWDVLAEHDFDPETDLRRNTHGVLELAGNKPAMRRAIEAYFRQRDEDANSMEA